MLTLERFYRSVDATGGVGLIVKKNRNSWEATREKVLSQLKWPYLTFDITKDVFPNDFLRTLLEAFETKKWLIVFVKHTWFPHPIYNQLRLLSRLQQVHILNLPGREDVIDMKLPRESRLVLVMDRENAYHKFEIPNFLDIVGPVYVLREI